MTFEERYQLQVPLGETARGSVWSAKDTKFKRSVVAITVDDDAPASTRDHFTEVWQQVKKARHPSLVRVFETGETDDGELFAAVEHADGESLATRLLEGPALRLDHATRLTVEIADALAAVHAVGGAHGDVEPGNIIVKERGGRLVAKLVGFGTGRGPIRAGIEALEEADHLATVAYLAPEQADGEMASPAADTYSVAAVLYSMLTGRLPHPGADIDAIRSHAREASLPKLAQLRPDLAGPIADVIDRALSSKSEERFSHATDLSKALRTALLKTRRPGAIETVVGERSLEPPPPVEEARPDEDSATSSSPAIGEEEKPAETGAAKPGEGDAGGIEAAGSDAGADGAAEESGDGADDTADGGGASEPEPAGAEESASERAEAEVGEAESETDDSSSGEEATDEDDLEFERLSGLLTMEDVAAALDQTKAPPPPPDPARRPPPKPPKAKKAKKAKAFPAAGRGFPAMKRRKPALTKDEEVNEPAGAASGDGRISQPIEVDIDLDIAADEAVPKSDPGVEVDVGAGSELTEEASSSEETATEDVTAEPGADGDGSPDAKASDSDEEEGDADVAATESSGEGAERDGETETAAEDEGASASDAEGDAEPSDAPVSDADDDGEASEPAAEASEDDDGSQGPDDETSSDSGEATIDLASAEPSDDGDADDGDADDGDADDGDALSLAAVAAAAAAADDPEAGDPEAGDPEAGDPEAGDPEAGGEPQLDGFTAEDEEHSGSLSPAAVLRGEGDDEGGAGAIPGWLWGVAAAALLAVVAGFALLGGDDDSTNAAAGSATPPSSSGPSADSDEAQDTVAEDEVENADELLVDAESDETAAEAEAVEAEVDGGAEEEVVELVVLTFTGAPEGAELRVDGELIDGLIAELAPDEEPHAVQISCEGYESFEQTVEATQDQTIEVSLERTPQEPAVTRPVAVQRPRVTPRQRSGATRRQPRTRRRSARRSSSRPTAVTDPGF